jgi:hypothetical protein
MSGQQVPPKRRLLGFILQKTAACIITTMWTWKQTRRLMTLFKRACHGLCPLPEYPDTYLHNIEPGSCSRCSDWLLDGRARAPNSSPARGKVYIIST